MLGIFGIFGRSQDIQRLDDAFRAVGLHPRIVPDAVKLTALKQLKEASGDAATNLRAYGAAAELLGYCVLGPRDFTSANDSELTEFAERRLLAAIEDGRNLDARLVLLALHAGLAHSSVVERFDLAAE
jgi:hypothetical protein